MPGNQLRRCVLAEGGGSRKRKRSFPKAWSHHRVRFNVSPTGFSSEIGTKLRESAIGQAGEQLLLELSIGLLAVARAPRLPHLRPRLDCSSRQILGVERPLERLQGGRSGGRALQRGN